MATSCDAAVYRMDPPLPTPYRLCRRPPVLEKMQLTLWLEHSTNLQERGVHIRNGAQGVAGEHTIHRSVRQIDLGTVDSHMLDPCGDAGYAWLRKPHRRRRRFDDEDLSHLGRIVAEVESGAESDLQDTTVQALADLGAPCVDLRRPHTRSITRGSTWSFHKPTRQG